MITPILMDIFIVAALLFFIWRGASKGFVLTLCSLVAVIVALVGASVIANATAPMAAEYLQPKLEQSIQESLEKKAQEISAQDYLSVSDVLSTLRDKGGVYEWAADGAGDLLRSLPSDTIAKQAAGAASAVALQVAHGVIFLLAFILLLIVWAVISHALDLVAKLPVLNSLNGVLGGALGLVKGLVVVYVAAWALCTLSGTIPEPMVAETRLLKYLAHLRLTDLLSGSLPPIV